MEVFDLEDTNYPVGARGRRERGRRPPRRKIWIARSAVRAIKDPETGVPILLESLRRAGFGTEEFKKELKVEELAKGRKEKVFLLMNPFLKRFVLQVLSEDGKYVIGELSFKTEESARAAAKFIKLN